MKKILLTGSTSYLGTKFIELFGDQFQILGIARSDKSNPVNLLNFKAVKDVYSRFRPDIIIHAAADVGRDSSTSENIVKTNPAATKNLVDLARADNTPFIFTSTEAVYGGKEQTGQYSETDPYKPRSPYGLSKVKSEEIIIGSGLPYLITRGHRHVGINKSFSRPKQFPDAINSLVAHEEIHLDSRKLFTPVLINHICSVFVHYIKHDADKQVLLNVGVDKIITYYDFTIDVANSLGLDTGLIKPDGEESGWPLNSTLFLGKLQSSGYPTIKYEEVLNTIKKDFSNL